MLSAEMYNENDIQMRVCYILLFPGTFQFIDYEKSVTSVSYSRLQYSPMHLSQYSHNFFTVPFKYSYSACNYLQKDSRCSRLFDNVLHYRKLDSR